jgi:RNA recognition motif-containing protein
MRDQNTVYISNLSYDIDRHHLKKIFSHFGEVKQVKLLMDQATQQSKGMAFIRMAFPEQAGRAIAGLNQQILSGRTVKVAPATPMKAASMPVKMLRPKAEQHSKAADQGRQESQKKRKQGPVALKDFLAQKHLKKGLNKV